MSFGIIIKKKPERYAIIRTKAEAARYVVSKENRQEYDTEKRALELNAKMPCGHPDAKAVAIAKMMSVPESQAKKWLNGEKKSKVVRDGKIN